MPDEARLCQGCAKALPDGWGICSQCGTHQHIVYRGPAGPVCAPCRFAAQVDTCTRCGRTTPCRFPGTPGAVCERCRKPRQPCSRCAQERIVATRDESGAPICHSCHHILEDCSVCHRHRRVVGRTEGAPLCEYCYPRHPVSFRDCTRCGRHAKLRQTGLCDRCTADDQLATLFPPELLERHETARTMLTALQAGDPATVRAAFHRHRAVELLRTVLATPDLLDHEALDDLGPEYTTRAVRALLVEHGLLPARNLPLARFQAWIITTAQLIEDPGERQAFVQFATWKHLRDLRSRAEPLSGPLVTSRRHELRVVLDLLAWARDRGKTLASLDQADLDHWATTGAEKYLVAGFLTWAHTNGRSQPLEITRPPRTYLLVGGLSDDQRRRVLDGVLNHDTITAGTKLAAALVLVFGFRPAQITRIRLDDIRSTGEALQVTVGKEPLLLPEPLADLATQTAADRSARRMFTPAQERPPLAVSRRSAGDTLVSGRSGAPAGRSRCPGEPGANRGTHLTVPTAATTRARRPHRHAPGYRRPLAQHRRRQQRSLRRPAARLRREPNRSAANCAFLGIQHRAALSVARRSSPRPEKRLPNEVGRPPRFCRAPLFTGEQARVDELLHVVADHRVLILDRRRRRKAGRWCWLSWRPC